MQKSINLQNWIEKVHKVSIFFTYVKIRLVLFRLNKLNNYFPCNIVTFQGFYLLLQWFWGKKKSLRIPLLLCYERAVHCITVTKVLFHCHSVYTSCLKDCKFHLLASFVSLHEMCELEFKLLQYGITCPVFKMPMNNRTCI